MIEKIYLLCIPICSASFIPIFGNSAHFCSVVLFCAYIYPTLVYLVSICYVFNSHSTLCTLLYILQQLTWNLTNSSPQLIVFGLGQLVHDCIARKCKRCSHVSCYSLFSPNPILFDSTLLYFTPLILLLLLQLYSTLFLLYSILHYSMFSDL